MLLNDANGAGKTIGLRNEMMVQGAGSPYERVVAQSSSSIRVVRA